MTTTASTATVGTYPIPVDLTALSVAVFVWALGLPYPLIVGLD